MDYYNTILSLINEACETSKDITYLARTMNVDRPYMVEFLNGDIQDKDLLLDIFNHLYPYANIQDQLFLEEFLKDCSNAELVKIYQNQDMLYESFEHIKKHQFAQVMNDVLRRICVNGAIMILENHSYEKRNPLL